MDDAIYALAVDHAGNLYAAGVFTAAGGVSANHVAKWDGTTWSALGSGIDDGVSALAVDRAGMLFAGGYFTTAGGVSANRVAKWDGTNWSPLGAGMTTTGQGDPRVSALVTDGAGNLYAGGYFSTAGGTPATNVAKWDGTGWSALGSGLDGEIFALAVDGAGDLYAGFSNAPSGNGVAKWDGTSWSAL